MTGAEHEELRQQLGLYVLGALTPDEQARVEAHLAECTDCAADVRAMQQSADALATLVEPVEPPAAVRQRILASIAPAAAPVVLQPKTVEKPTWLPWLAAAAALALAVGLGGYATQLRGRVQILEQQLRDAVAQLRDGERQTTQARLVAADAQRQLSVLAAPDVAHVDLKGQKVAPQASARALWSRSKGLLLSASNLPPLPAGQIYQLWVISGTLPPISDGWVFKTDTGGAVTAMFNTPVTLPPPTAMAVTNEPEGGTRAPTGVMYLVGSPN